MQKAQGCRGHSESREGGQSVSWSVWGLSRENAGTAGRDQTVQTQVKEFSFYPKDNGESMKCSQ